MRETSVDIDSSLISKLSLRLMKNESNGMSLGLKFANLAASIASFTSLPQCLHLMASGLIISAQYGHLTSPSASWLRSKAQASFLIISE